MLSLRILKFPLGILPLVLLFLSCSPDEPREPQVKVTLTTQSLPSEGGSVSPSAGNYLAGKEVILTAEPAEGWEFVAWEGDLSGSENPVKLQMDQSKSVEAVFKNLAESIVIFSINDPHGKIDNFGRIKALIDAEKERESQVFFVSGGDIFSGNPIVDYHPEKGSPIVDLMGKAGMDVSVIGNHEFDYGQSILNKRLEQASFNFLLGNATDNGAVFNIPEGILSIEKDGFEIAFIGVVETGSHDNKPQSHPKNLKGLEFTEGVEAVAKYEGSELVKRADLVVALTHYGKWGDRSILQQHDFIDLVIGGHNHDIYSEQVNGRYMVQSGGDLKFLTKLSLEVSNGEVTNYEYKLIDLNRTTQTDAELEAEIEAYNNIPELFVEIGTSLEDHNSTETGCFYTDALRTITGADIVFQNYGGIRAGLDQGSITPFDIYTIDPFGNGLETYTMTVAELETFLNSPGVSGLSYSGLSLVYRNGQAGVYNEEGTALKDEEKVVIGLSDYLSSIYADFFSMPTMVYEKTTADYLIEYLREHQSVINYDDCERSAY